MRTAEVYSAVFEVLKMNTTEHTISKNSIWLTATPAPFAQTLPFYLTEAGSFEASENYAVSRDGGGGFLLFYTLKGCGSLEQDGHSVSLPENSAVILDCSMPYYYHASGGGWDFIWFYINGSGMRAMFDIIYPDGIFAADMKDDTGLRGVFSEISVLMRGNDAKSLAEMSACLHRTVNSVLYAALDKEKSARPANASDDIRKVVQYIQACYGEPMTLDDMVARAHMSKYHFIRLFKRVIGVTPYRYLTAHRINAAKTLLRTTDMQVGEIAEKCGFSDTSNFVVQFKKHAGQKPLEYRKDFSQ